MKIQWLSFTKKRYLNTKIRSNADPITSITAKNDLKLTKTTITVSLSAILFPKSLHISQQSCTSLPYCSTQSSQNSQNCLSTSNCHHTSRNTTKSSSLAHTPHTCSDKNCTQHQSKGKSFSEKRMCFSGSGTISQHSSCIHFVST